MMLMKYICVYHERSGTVQFARMESIKDYINWADSAHANGIRWSHLIEKDTGQLVMTFKDEQDGDKKYHFY